MKIIFSFLWELSSSAYENHLLISVRIAFSFWWELLSSFYKDYVIILVRIIIFFLWESSLHFCEKYHIVSMRIITEDLTLSDKCRPLYIMQKAISMNSVWCRYIQSQNEAIYIYIQISSNPIYELGSLKIRTDRGLPIDQRGIWYKEDY